MGESTNVKAALERLDKFRENLRISASLLHQAAENDIKTRAQRDAERDEAFRRMLDELMRDVGEMRGWKEDSVRARLQEEAERAKEEAERVRAEKIARGEKVPLAALPRATSFTVKRT
eukprot:CAMPEP_0206259386 /NCGR_PEP_ID=MMETSP0047_2-20121206/26459_1 /ASSEMBLY_ACC=CAM_ASM_000192 /TAXON_ID=195065 /ORGANISM="Chroomonas mesostigmatica_cf, Strain CCMP1168" /LENGTH=117 /DNA_ID=CAMNT_0053686261 /DNA_START=214 /DNA_END=563 /DNA_ORIENTATION=-